MRAEILTVSDQLLTGAINGVYQGIILVVFVWLMLRWLGRTNAATRHAAWFGTLLLLAGLIPAQCWYGHLVLAQGAKASVRPTAPDPDLVTRSRSESPLGETKTTVRTEPMEETAPAPDQELSALSKPLVEDGELSDFLPSLDDATPERELQGAAQVRSGRSSTLAGGSNSMTRPAGLFRPRSWNLSSLSTIPRGASLVVFALWGVAAVIRVTLLFWRLRQVRKLKASSLPASPALDGLFQALRTKLAVNRRVELKVSRTHRSPVVVGFLHPVVLLPSEEPGPDQLTDAEHILRHELAHVRRWDDWANLVQHSVQAVLFFHPAVWWISKQLSLEREVACDDYVLQQGGRPRPYALLLANLAGRMRGRQPLIAPGASSSKSQLQQRINMILNTQRNTSPCLAKTRLGFITSGAALIAVLAIYSGPRIILAQSGAVITAPKAAGAAGAGGISAGRSGVLPALAPIQIPDSEDAPPTPAPADVDSGPKHKLGDIPDAATPQPALPPVPPLAPFPSNVPMLAARPSRAMPGTPPAAFTPRPPRLPDEAEGSSIEERLDRLERMVRSLVAQQSPKHNQGHFHEKAAAEQELMTHQRELEQLRERSVRDAKREVEQAQRDAKQAQRELKFEGAHRAPGAVGDFSKQIEELRRQRESLTRQMEMLDRQIERMDQERARLDQLRQRLDNQNQHRGELEKDLPAQPAAPAAEPAE